jgi:hypothetical protein
MSILNNPERQNRTSASLDLLFRVFQAEWASHSNLLRHGFLVKVIPVHVHWAAFASIAPTSAAGNTRYPSAFASAWLARSLCSTNTFNTNVINANNVSKLASANAAG